MKFPELALLVAAAAAPASAYAIEADGVNCRAGPSTSDKVLRTYNKGHQVKLECQTAGQNINGDSLWDKTTDGCFVADYYVKTGTSGMVTGQCRGAGGAINAKISRQDIIARGQYWVSKHVPYSMDATYPDQQGTRYRTDCSGFVTMALHATPPGYSTVTLPEICKPISWAELQPGDLVGTLGPGTGGAAGHVTLFHSWADASRSSYNTLECRGGAGCVAYKRPVGWKDGPYTAKPYRYIRVE
ncbi:NlpC/P60-like cell-wall peptidase [Metarhizium album ARSEF 1941]|uniref:NlpC/P60-like cell-wall peptidase n=1 Tax=Metarhizium album (strain ARSEF 1941) TaxID=1081103 RepID=A0A0B2WXG5_METAS|nr:NlpC/P60-like cell-wall peptidase [Metarhizium album ARSEF 1941]KHN97565.1 NlpC/P60-like cell-wall peptidase [Metarhizium album ARSEF 1941]